MPHGAPDWSDVKKKGIDFRIDDFAELAARLYSPCVFDKRGSYHWSDDFSNGLDIYTFTFAGVGSTYKLDNEVWERPPYSLFLEAANVGGGLSQVRFNVARPLTGRIGFAVSLRPYSEAQDFRIELYYYTGTQRYVCRVKVLTNTYEIQYQNNLGVWAKIGTLPGLLEDSTCFYHFKVVFDTDELKLDRVLVDNLSITNINGSIPVFADAARPSIQGRVGIYRLTTGPSQLWVDNIVITHNEP